MNSPNPKRNLFDLLNQLIALKLEYLQLLSLEKGTLILGGVLLVLCCLFFFSFMLLCLSFALAYYLGYLLGEMYWGFLIIASIYVILAVILILARNILIINPLMHIIYKSIIKHNNFNETTNRTEEQTL